MDGSFFSIIVANQFYQSSSEEEYVIVGNDAIVKCKIPSFVADFVSVVAWQDNEEKLYYENKDYGKENGECHKLFVVPKYLLP